MNNYISLCNSVEGYIAVPLNIEKGKEPVRIDDKICLMIKVTMLLLNVG